MGMAMAVDLRVGESVIAQVESAGKQCEILVTLGKKRGGGGTVARLLITAPQTVVLIPPNKQNLGNPEK
jgi:hypothetical protein